MPVFAILTDANLPRTLVSTFSVEDVIVKGPNKDVLSVAAGKFFIFIVTVALPSIILKSGRNFLIFIKGSLSPSFPPKLKSPDSINAGIAVRLPWLSCWSTPFS